MTEAIASIIGSFITLIGVIFTVWAGNRKTQNLVEYQIKELQKKVEAHNGVVNRTAILETDMANVKEDIREIKRTIGGNHNE